MCEIGHIREWTSRVRTDATTILPPKFRLSKILYVTSRGDCVWGFWDWCGSEMWWFIRSEIWSL